MSTEQQPEQLWDLVLNLILHPDRQDFMGCWKAGEHTTISSWEFARRVLELSAGLKQVIEPGERIALIGSSSPLWMACDLAIMGAGGVTVPMFKSMPANIFKHQVQCAKTKRFILLEADIVQDWSDISIKSIYTPDDCRMTQAEQLSLSDLEQSLPLKQKAMQETWSDLHQHNKHESLATILFTSGSTGIPKGIPLTHQNMISQILGAHQRFPLNPKDDLALSFLPLAHIFERMVTYYYLFKRIPIHFCDTINKLGERMKEAQPTVMTTVPRLLEKVQASMSQRTMSKPSPNKEIGRWALSLALTQPLGKDWPLLSWFMADQLVYKKFREALGGKLNMLIVGGAPLSPRLARFFNNIGIPTFQGYGLSETSPVIAANYPGNNREGKVGKAFPNVSIKIDPMDGEVLAKGPNLMSGYLDNQDGVEVENIIDEQGWLHTGDLGELDEEGFLSITGRKKEMFKTSNGKYVCPIPIEERLTRHPWVDQAVVIAEGRTFVSALLVPDPNAIPEEFLHWIQDPEAQQHGYPDDHPLAIHEHLLELNGDLNPWEKVQKVAWLPQVLSIENNELTPTMKVKRHIVEKKYTSLINELYNSKP